MRGSDIEHVSRIERKAMPTQWSMNAYITELANPAAAYLVATVNDVVVGYGGTWVIMDEAHITTLAVEPACRGYRIGERLLSELLTAAEAKGGTRATLEVREHNTAARNLYRKYGFIDVAMRKGYYSDNNENAVIMWINDMNDVAWRERYRALRSELNLPGG